MRIAYLGRWSTDAGDGVRAKVETQAAEWRRRGHDVDVFRLPLVGYGRSAEPGGRRLAAGAVAGSIVATARTRRAIARFAPDVAYVRYGLYLPWLRPLQRRVPTVVELNANDRAEAGTLGHRGRRALNELSRRSLLSEACALVCVAHEIARSVTAFGKPTRVIANGVDLDAVTPAPPRASGRPLAVFLAGVPMPWHGIDRLLALAAALPDWDFALIGLERSALTAPAPANVDVRPPMRREDYADVLARADVGIGSLAMHRAGLDEASPLKVREYLAHGLPVVLGFEDTDFAGAEPWFLLQLPNAGDAVPADAERLRSFGEAVRGRRVAREEIARIDWRAKEDERLAFMAEVAATAPRAPAGPSPAPGP
jgi:glycosyltransferase involved in cell wall biosynthesis